MKYSLISGLVILFFSWQVNVLAAIDLFDSNRGKQKKPPQAAPANKGNTKSGKKLNITLKFMGASLMGNTTRLYFKNKRNQTIAVKWKKDKKVALPEFYDLLIEKYENRILYVQYPKNKQCVENKRNAVYCEKNNRLSMHIVRAKSTRPLISKTARKKNTSPPRRTEKQKNQQQIRKNIRSRKITPANK